MKIAPPAGAIIRQPQEALRIPYQTEGFPPGSVANGFADLPVTWDDILWAAVTVGRSNRHYVFRHGMASRYEAVFRWSLVRMALEQRGSWAYRLHRTDSAKTLDPTEKGAVNYFLGMTFCKLFAAKLLNTPWLLHLDVFRPTVNSVLRGRSRPDLIGQQARTGQWHAFECKGRISPPGSSVKQKAKAQAQRLVRVGATSCGLHIGAITYFLNDALQFYWCDPTLKEGNHIVVPSVEDAWRYYYSPVVQMIVSSDNRVELMRSTNVFIEVNGLDLEVGIHPIVARPLLHERWGEAYSAAIEAASEITQAGYQPDGLAVRAGSSWRERFQDSQE